MTRYTIKLLARIVFPLGEPNSEGERGGGVGIGRICGLFNNVDAVSFKKQLQFLPTYIKFNPTSYFSPLSTVNNLRLRYLRNGKNSLLCHTRNLLPCTTMITIWSGCKLTTGSNSTVSQNLGLRETWLSALGVNRSFQMDTVLKFGTPILRPEREQLKN